jgi:TRAP-type C4-dicarboxylate transport system permease small subunit
MPRKILRRLERAAALWEGIEQVLLSVLVVGMVAVAALQIVLRNIFHTGLAWGGAALGGAMLWMTMLGALAATGATRHITVDLVSHVLPSHLREVARAVTNLFSSVVSGLLTRAALRYVLLQREMGAEGMGGSSWTLYVILPVCLALLTFRFALQAVCSAARAVRSGRPAAGVEGEA